MGQAAARAQAHAHHRPDIVTRGSRRTAGLRPRVNFYLVKPFTPREFTEMLTPSMCTGSYSTSIRRSNADESREGSTRGRGLPTFRVLRTECRKGPDRHSGRRRKHRAPRGRSLDRPEYHFDICAGGEAALARIVQTGANVVISDIRMPGLGGIELLRRLRGDFPNLPVVLLTSQGSISDAVAAMRDGAFSYVTHPIDRTEIRALVEQAVKMSRLERENRHLRAQVRERYRLDSFVAVSKASGELVNFIRRIAPSRSSVIVQGESGTGKELVARLIHFWSDRVGQPFVAINCKAFAEGVLESELFGHEKGAFTGAVAARAGCFERASGGTLFLDEIGEISKEFQVKLLRVLQEGELLRVGGTQPIKAEVRVVAATNRILKDEVAAGRFREDLFFRLAVIPITLTPLRERRDDILPLARHFIRRHAVESGRRLELSDMAQQALLTHPWRGNVRELENAIERAVVLCRDNLIESEDMLLESYENGHLTHGNDNGNRLNGNFFNGNTASAEKNGEGTLQEAADRLIASRIIAALQRTGGNRAAAARMLGMNRPGLYPALKRLGLDGVGTSEHPLK